MQIDQSLMYQPFAPLIAKNNSFMIGLRQSQQNIGQSEYFSSYPDNIKQSSLSFEQTISKNNLSNFTTQTSSRNYDNTNINKNKNMINNSMLSLKRQHNRNNRNKHLSNKITKHMSNELINFEIKSVSNNSNDKIQQIYTQIIRILQKQNINLKQHNAFLKKQYKKLLIKYNKQKQTKSYQQQHKINKEKQNLLLQQLNQQIYRLKQINAVYKNQISQFKEILINQVGSIKLKFQQISIIDHQSWRNIERNNNNTNNQVDISIENMRQCQNTHINNKQYKDNQIITSSNLIKILSIQSLQNQKHTNTTNVKTNKPKYTNKQNNFNSFNSFNKLDQLSQTQTQNSPSQKSSFSIVKRRKYSSILQDQQEQ